MAAGKVVMGLCMTAGAVAGTWGGAEYSHNYSPAAIVRAASNLDNQEQSTFQLAPPDSCEALAVRAIIHVTDPTQVVSEKVLKNALDETCDTPPGAGHEVLAAKVKKEVTAVNSRRIILHDTLRGAKYTGWARVAGFLGGLVGGIGLGVGLVERLDLEKWT